MESIEAYLGPSIGEWDFGTTDRYVGCGNLEARTGPVSAPGCQGDMMPERVMLIGTIFCTAGVLTPKAIEQDRGKVP